MAIPQSSRLQNMLQAAVQSVEWTYSLFWQFCPQQGILVWRDGYYNGAIKTRKTVQPMEVSAEEASLQRSQQLRELYESLSAGETNQPTRRPCAALSPEDLTESEWFYLMCVSFSFPPGVGLPGKAYARRQQVWLTGANEIDSKTFSRAILAKSARIQTVVCIPLLDGVVEFGTTEKIEEDPGFIHRVKGFFTDHHYPPPPPPKPALSEQSTSNPAASSDHFRFQSPLPAMYAAAHPPNTAGREEEDEDEEENDEDEEDGLDSEAEAETGRNTSSVPMEAQHAPPGMAAEPSELMQLEMSEDIRLGSPDDGSNHLDSDMNLIGLAGHRAGSESFRAESVRRWGLAQDPLSNTVPPGQSAAIEMAQEDTHYSQTVATILQTRSLRWPDSSSTAYLPYSTQSAFAKWTTRPSDHHLLHAPVDSTSQCFLKYILFTVPYLHQKHRNQNSPKSHDGDYASRFRKSAAASDDLSANHVLAERRRREKLNERFIILRSLVPFVTKMDKASILGDTIEYVKQLRKKIQDLEARNRQIEIDRPSRSAEPPQRTSSLKEQRSGVTVDRGRISPSPAAERKKLKVAEKGKAPSPVETNVEVSIIESDALVELECRNREGLLLDIMQMLRDRRIETTAVQSSISSGFFVAELRAKVKDNVTGKKVSIMEVKRAIRQIIPLDS